MGILNPKSVSKKERESGVSELIGGGGGKRAKGLTVVKLSLGERGGENDGMKVEVKSARIVRVCERKENMFKHVRDELAGCRSGCETGGPYSYFCLKLVSFPIFVGTTLLYIYIYSLFLRPYFP